MERAPRLPTSVGMLPGRERDLWTWERADTPDHNLSFDRICEAYKGAKDKACKTQKNGVTTGPFQYYGKAYTKNAYNLNLVKPNP